MNITPADLELVDSSDVVVGDVLVSFTPTGRDIVIPATPRQLARLSSDRILTVDAISSPRTGILDLGTGPNRWTNLLTAKVWRVKH